MASTPSNRSPSPPPMNGEGGGSAPRCASWVYSLSVSGRDTVEIPALPNQPAYSGRRREGTGRGGGGCWGGRGGRLGRTPRLVPARRVAGGGRWGGPSGAGGACFLGNPPPHRRPRPPPNACGTARVGGRASHSRRHWQRPPRFRPPPTIVDERVARLTCSAGQRAAGPRPRPRSYTAARRPPPLPPAPPPTQLTRRVRVPRASDAATRSVPEPRGHTVAASTPPAARPSPAVPLLPTSPTSPLRTPPRPPPPPRAAPRRAPRVAPRAHSRDAGRARVRRPPRLLPAGWGRQLGPHGGGWVRGEAGGQRGGEERVCRGAVTLWPRPLCGVGVTHLGRCV